MWITSYLRKKNIIKINIFDLEEMEEKIEKTKEIY